MALIKKRVFVQTNEAITLSNDVARTGLYFDGHNQLTNSVKGYRKTENESGEEVYNEVVEIDNSKVVNVLEY